MFLADHQIEHLCTGGVKIRIDPFNPMNVGPNSYDLTLDGEYRLLYSDWGKRIEMPWYRNRNVVVSKFALDKEVPPSKHMYAKEVLDESGTNRHYLIVPPFHSVIVRTQEVVYIGDGFLGLVSARSNLSYVLNMFHSSLVDTGFVGRLTARIYNPATSELWLPAGYRFLQMMIATAESPYEDYSQRKLSKNLQYVDDLPDYKIDKEWLGFREPPKEEELSVPPTPQSR